MLNKLTLFKPQKNKNQNKQFKIDANSSNQQSSWIWYN